MDIVVDQDHNRWDLYPWPIPKIEEHGLKKDCILVARMQGAEMISVSIYCPDEAAQV